MIFSTGGRIFPTSPTKTSLTYTVKSACQSISKIIFNEINNNLLSSINSLKVTNDEVTLNNLYSELRKGYLRDYVDNLPDADDHFSQCEDVFQLMRYMKNEEKFGFEPRDYEIPKSIVSYLDNLSSVLNGYADAYTLSDATISVIGYADARGFGGEKKLESELTIRYYPGVCPEDEAKEPVFVTLGKRNGSTEIEQLKDNCQLSAARARMVLGYLKSKVRSIDVVYQYAAGGIKDKRKRDILENRSILISIKMNAGK